MTTTAEHTTHQISSLVPRGFRFSRTVDLTTTLEAREYQFRHADGRLHVVRLRNDTGDLMLSKTFTPSWRW